VACAEDATIVARMAIWLVIALSLRKTEVVVNAEVATKSALNAIRLVTLHVTVPTLAVVKRIVATSASVLRVAPYAGTPTAVSMSKAGTTTTKRATTTGLISNSRTTTLPSTKAVAGTMDVSTESFSK